MNDTLAYIAKKFELDLTRRCPIDILKINRKIMAQTLCELGLTEGAEIGVAKGEHAALLMDNNPSLHLYAIDPWDAYPGYVDYTQDKLDSFYGNVRRYLTRYKNCTIVRKKSMEAVLDFEDNQLDFVYIDGAHDFKSVAEDICDWSRKVRVGGIVFGHDYYMRTDKPTNIIHVKQVVQAYMYSHNISPWFVLGMQGNFSDGEYHEHGRSWMFVRQESDRL